MNETQECLMEQQVTVMAIEADHALVRGRRASACGGCAGKTSCSTMGSWVERFVELRVKNTLAANVGDEIILEVPDAAVMRIAFRLYAMPMVAFVGLGLAMRALALAMEWPAVEALAALAGFAGVLAYYVSYKLYLSDHQSGLDVQMKRVVYAASAPPFEVVLERGENHSISIPLLHSTD